MIIITGEKAGIKSLDEIKKVQQELDQSLPLVIEILPGQAKTGLSQIYQPDEYKGKNVRDLVEDLLSKASDPTQSASLEDKRLARVITEELRGGHLVYQGERLEDRRAPTHYATPGETQQGEKYLYVQIRAIKPQEGGISLLKSYHK